MFILSDFYYFRNKTVIRYLVIKKKMKMFFKNRIDKLMKYRNNQKKIYHNIIRYKISHIISHIKYLNIVKCCK